MAENESLDLTRSRRWAPSPSRSSVRAALRRRLPRKPTRQSWGHSERPSRTSPNAESRSSNSSTQPKSKAVRPSSRSSSSARGTTSPDSWPRSQGWGGTRDTIIEEFVLGVRESILDQIGARVVPCERWKRFSDLRSHLARVKEHDETDVHWIVEKFSNDPNWSPRQGPCLKGTVSAGQHGRDDGLLPDGGAINGKLDRYYDVSFDDDQAGSSVELIGGKHFRLDQACFGDHLLAALSPRMIDLLRIATSIYVIDSIAGRDRRSEWLGWSRTLRLRSRCSITTSGGRIRSEASSPNASISWAATSGSSTSRRDVPTKPPAEHGPAALRRCSPADLPLQRGLDWRRGCRSGYGTCRTPRSSPCW